MVGRVSSPDFVGRDAELALLRERLDGAAAGNPSVILLGGESGVGKTRLLEQALADARARDFRVLVGRCVELGANELPFASVAGALRPLVRSADPVLAELPPSLRAALAALLPEIGADPSATLAEDVSGASPQRLLFEAVLGLLDRLGRTAPVLLALEDLHWADSSTRDLVAFLARNLGDERLLVAATYRSDELHRRHPLRPLLARLESDRVQRIDLDPFGRDELEALLEGILGEPASPKLADQIHERSEGNALFAEELLAVNACGDGCIELPETLRDALLTRVEGLDPTAREVLRLGAVADRPFQHALLRELSSLDEPALLAGAREAISRHFLVVDDDGCYTFRHQLVNEAIYSDLLPGERTELHVAIARAYEADPRLLGAELQAAALDAELACHYRAAQDMSAALGPYVRAGRVTLARAGFQEARRHFDRALEAWPRVPDAAERAGCDHAELLALAADANAWCAQHARAVAHLRLACDEVDPNTDPRRAAALRTSLGRALWQLGEGEQALGMYREALALLPDEPSVERARALGFFARAKMLMTRFTTGACLARDAVADAAAVSEPAEECRSLTTLGVCVAQQGDAAEGEAALRHALAIAEEHELPRELSHVIVNLSDVLQQHDRTEDALDVLRRGFDWLRERGFEVQSFDLFASMQEVELLTRLGRWQEAADKMPRSAPDPDEGVQAIFFHAMTAEIGTYRGEEEMTARALERLRALTQRVLDVQWLVPLHSDEGLLALARGDIDAARGTIAEGLERVAGSQHTPQLARLIWVGLRAESEAAALAPAHGTGADEATIERLEEQLYGLIDVGRTEFHARVALARAEARRARRRDRAEEWLAAAELLDTSQLPWYAAYARLRAAEAAVAAGDRAGASAPLSAAIAEARRVGARQLLSDAEALARRGRVAIVAEEPVAAAAGADGREQSPPLAEPAAAPIDSLGLTPRELEVLRLVAEGKTNREIGAELFMSEKTASVHVSRILAKLEVRGRVEAAAVAHRLGLTTA